jgi:hypothetical protein
MGSLDVGGDAGGLFLLVGIVVVVTLVTLPFVGRFFAAAFAGGVVIAGAILVWHARRRR